MTKKRKLFLLFFLSFALLFITSCGIIFTTSLGKFAGRKKIPLHEFKTISQMLKEAKDNNIIYDYDASRSFIENISEYSASEIFSLSMQEKDQILNIAVAGTTNIGKIFEIITASFDETKGELDMESNGLREKLLKRFNTKLNIKSVKTILTDKKYLEEGSLDSIVFGMCILLSNSADIIGYNLTQESLDSGNSEKILDKIAKANIEEIIYGYKIIYKRPDLERIEFSGVKLKNLLPKIKV